MSKLLELALRCEQATGPDRELDANIADAIMAPLDWGMSAARYTASLDAAMTLVPEELYLQITRGEDVSWAGLTDNNDDDASCFGDHSQSLVLALCAAALRARAAMEAADA